MELKDLAGQHLLTGVENSGADISFILDGITYTAVEDPSDGYRSMLQELRIGGEVKNTFQPVGVVAKLTDNDNIMELIDIANGKTILRTGTSNYDDYYPCFIAEWSPENMAINSEARRAPEPLRDQSAIGGELKFKVTVATPTTVRATAQN